MTRWRPLFGCAIFLASFLLFLVEPIAAKQLLPTFGGSAAVWITCLVFFQTALLAAYLYAHWLTRRPLWTLHLALLLVASGAAILWRLAQPSASAITGGPVLAIFAALSLSIGLPFLMLGATSPLLQVWLARIESTGIPYRLYALSNVASLLALGFYPTVIEPNFSLKTQWLAWTAGFVVFAILSAILTWKTRTNCVVTADLTQEVGPATPLSKKLLWIALPMAGSMQLSAVTSHLTANVAAIPLLWILPLGVYLITLILAFQYPRLLPRWIVTRLLVVMLASLAYMLSQFQTTLPLRVAVIFFLAELFVSAIFCHAEAVNLRPARPSESTLFYLFFAAGGALGTFLTGIVFPLIFSCNFDLPISFLMTALFAVAVTWREGWAQRALWSVSSLLLIVLLGFLNTAYHRQTLVAVRNFYGALRVNETIAYPGSKIRTLTNGSIQHGTQIFSDELRRTPTTYYAPDSGVGLAMKACCNGRAANEGRDIGVIGLGVGTLAAYGQAGDRMRFYEINPAVIPIAQHFFTYMRESPAQIDIVTGDARTSLAAELESGAPQHFDVLVVDAFSGDAIPLHLLTTQALELYKRHLAPGGVLAFHISNQHVDLEPEVAQLAKAAGMTARRFVSPINVDRGEFSATWILLSADPAFFQIPEIFNHAHVPSETPHVPVWTDDYSSLLPVLHW
jgi:hypothetical protein